MVRSVLSSPPVYLLTVIKAPKKFLKELDKLGKRFLWAGDSELTGAKCRALRSVSLEQCQNRRETIEESLRTLQQVMPILEILGAEQVASVPTL